MSAVSPGWYLRRLSQMSPREVGWRISDVVRQRSWARDQVVDWEELAQQPGPSGMASAPGFATLLPSDARSRVPVAAADATLAAADRLLAGEWDVLGVPRSDIVDPDWFQDAVTGRRAPDRQLCFSIDHRNEHRVGNIKSLWEVSRHHHLTLLAAAYWLSSDDRYAEAVDAQLRSWWARNPFLSGVHWTSGIEVGVRLISWAWVRRLLHGWPGASSLFEGNLVARWQIWWHQRFLEGFTSRGSSANNHVVAEAAGLLVGSTAFTWYGESQKWQARARRLLEDELTSNTFPSGVNRELATDYHRFVTELAVVAAVEASAAGAPLSWQTWQLLGRSMDAAAALLDSTGRAPRQGDGDDGIVLLLDDPDQPSWMGLLSIGEALMGGASWWPATSPTLTSVVLGTLHGNRVGVEHAASRPDEFGDAGITILRSPSTDEPDLWCRCDAGPHGFLSIAAHGHADALSVELRCDGVDVLADPGTYCYHGSPQWRAYFRSTLGHNTLEIGGEDQSVSGGPFLWTHHAVTKRLPSRTSAPSVLTWSAEHSGYGRLAPAVVHRRTVDLDTVLRRLTVRDQVMPQTRPLRRATSEPAPTVQVRLAWHLGPTIRAHLDGRTAILSWDDAQATRRGTLTLPDQLTWTSHSGEEDPVRGWYSPSFGVKVPTNMLVGSGAVRADSGPLVTRVDFAAD